MSYIPIRAKFQKGNIAPIVNMLKPGFEIRYRCRDLVQILKDGLRDYLEIYEVLSRDKFIEIRKFVNESYVYPKLKSDPKFTFFYYIDEKGQLFSDFGKECPAMTERCIEKTKLKPCQIHTKLWINPLNTNIGSLIELEGTLYGFDSIENLYGRETCHLIINEPGFSFSKDSEEMRIHRYYDKKTGILLREGNAWWQSELVGATISL
jgi:hypothetical protein